MRLRSTVLDPVAVRLLVLAVVLLAVDVAALGAWGWYAPRQAAVREVAFAATWMVAGAAALALGRGHMARLMLLLGAVLAAVLTGGLQLGAGGWPADALTTVVAVLVPFQAAVAGHVLLAFPSGRLDPPAVRLVRAGYALGVVESVWFATSVGLPGCPACAANRLAMGARPEWTRLGVAAVLAGCWLVLAGGLAVLLVRRYRAAGSRLRGLLLVPYCSIGLTIVVFAVLTVVGAPSGASAFGISAQTVVVFQVVSLLGVPACFVVGLVRERLAYARVGDLVRDLGGPGEHDVQGALALALEDPELEVVYLVDGEPVDGSGRPVRMPSHDPRRRTTPVGEASDPLALLVHDRSLADEPRLLTAAGSAVRLALENARLQAQVRSQLLDVRESRARIVAASDEARRRLERDLHDGAQQRLLAVGMALRMLHSSASDDELLDEAQRELAAGLAELRELAAGIHPAVLTDRGLGPALQDLATRMGPAVQVRMSGGDPGRFAPTVEAAVYFAASEAVANALKHAKATSIVTEIGCKDGRLVTIVRDDGGGGADPTGSGLRGIGDRMASVDGALRVDSPSGAGTTVTLVVPCA